MDLFILAKGIVIGFLVAAPVGPIGLLCVQRTLEHGTVVGFSTGLGAAVADAVFGVIAVFGLAAATVWIGDYHLQLQAFGGVVLLILGLRTWTAKPPAVPTDAGAAAAPAPAWFSRAHWFTGFSTGMIVTLTNPMTVFGFVSIFLGFGVARLVDSASAWTLVAGIFAGSAAWWLGLSGGVALVRHRFSDRTTRIINRTTAILLAAFGAFALYAGLSGRDLLPT